MRKYDRWSNTASQHHTMKEAVRYELTPAPYSFNGELEQLRETVHLQSEMIAQLIETLDTRQPFTRKQLELLLPDWKRK